MSIIKAIILDWAGTTVDYGCFAPLEAFIQAFNAFGINPTMEETRLPMGMQKRAHIESMLEGKRLAALWKETHGRPYTSEDVDQIYQQFEPALFQVLVSHCSVLPGVVDAIAKIREMGIAIGSTTGYSKEIMEVVMPLAQEKGYQPDCMICPDDVDGVGRPYPYMLWRNLEELSVSSISEVLKIGDTVADIQEGKNAGCISVGILEGSSMLGLSEADMAQIDSEELDALMLSAEQGYKQAGADYVIENILSLPKLVQSLDQKEQIPDNPYILLTPGPLSTSKGVRNALLRDWCTWDADYNEGIVQVIRHRLVALATDTPQEYTAILMQGSGSFSVEATLGSVVPEDGKILIVSNGAYGKRMVQIAEVLGLRYFEYALPETEVPDHNVVATLLEENPDLTHFAMVHCETTTGMLNPLEEIAPIVKNRGLVFIVDAMSSFGGIPLDVDKLGIDFLISSANKCIQGVPGFAFIIARREELQKSEGNARSLCLDLFDQWKTMDRSGKWRYTSPTHTVRAFYRALEELEEEGGIPARFARYSKNQQLLVGGMATLGYEALLPRELQSPIITSFLYPDPEFDFFAFYQAVKKQGFVLYPGKITQAASFRIGNIGEVYPEDIKRLLSVIQTIEL